MKVLMNILYAIINPIGASLKIKTSDNKINNNVLIFVLSLIVTGLIFLACYFVGLTHLWGI